MTASTFASAAVAAALFVAAPGKERVEDVVQRGAQWVQRFERDFITVIADETYDQSVTRSVTPSQHRQIRSEILFVRGAADDTWLTVRNVLSYADEGKPPVEVPDSHDRLQRTLAAADGDGRRAVRQLADEGARFNIGRIARNFNSPTLALQWLDEGHRARFRFRLEGQEPVGADAALRLSYNERQHPTLIQANYRDTELSGRIWTRASDGAVLRTSMELVAEANRGLTGVKSLVTVDYIQDPKLGTMVPSRMVEELRWRGNRVNDEVIRGTAVYSNYRVFETSARVIVPQ